LSGKKKMTFFIIRRHVDFIFGMILFAAMTQLYRLVPVVLSLDSLASVTFAITLLSVTYVLLNLRVVSRNIGNPFLWFFVVAMLVWPLATLLYAADYSVNSILFQLHYFALLLASAIFFRRISKHRYIFIGAILATLVGVIASLLYPSAFFEMANLASARIDYFGRGFGLFLQPNLLAYNLIILALLLGLSTERSKARFFTLGFTIVFAALFLSGSRGGVATGGVLLLSIFILDGMVKSKQFYIAMISAVPASLVLLFVLLGIDISPYIDRIGSLFAGQWAEQGSVQLRTIYQERFLTAIIEKPILGYGLGSYAGLHERGVLLGAAHNQVLDTMLQFGLVGVVFMMVGALVLYRSFMLVPTRRIISSPVTTLLVVGLIMLGTNMLFSMQNFYVFLGYIISQGMTLEKRNANLMPTVASPRDSEEIPFSSAAK